MLLFNNKKIEVQSLELKDKPPHIRVQILRLDEIHPIISGNKIFKLQIGVLKAKQQRKLGIITCGGAYSNHIVATAAVCKACNLESIGLIRGDETEQLNSTLQNAVAYGMKLIFVDRTTYKDKKKLQQKFLNEHFFWIEEGGFGIDGAEGAKEISTFIDDRITHIICACGTGTMMAGLIKGAKKHQKVIGISVLKGYENLINTVSSLLTNEERKIDYQIFNHYHFGGYAKHPQELINYMNACFTAYNLPTDIVYTGKLLFAVEDLIKKDFFGQNANIMIIHSGGLQGNASLPDNALLF